MDWMQLMHWPQFIERFDVPSSMRSLTSSLRLSLRKNTLCWQWPIVNEAGQGKKRTLQGTRQSADVFLCMPEHFVLRFPVFGKWPLWDWHLFGLSLRFYKIHRFYKRVWLFLFGTGCCRKHLGGAPNSKTGIDSALEADRHRMQHSWCNSYSDLSQFKRKMNKKCTCTNISTL